VERRNKTTRCRATTGLVVVDATRARWRVESCVCALGVEGDESRERVREEGEELVLEVGTKTGVEC
jgi:hypothetical protein